MDALKEVLDQQTWPHDENICLAEACSFWPVKQLPLSARQPVVSSAKVLLLGGELDLNTWTDWGELAAAGLSNGTHLIVPHTAHATIWNDCVSQITTSFILNDGDITKTDRACLSAIPAPAW